MAPEPPGPGSMLRVFGIRAITKNRKRKIRTESETPNIKDNIKFKNLFTNKLW